MMMYSSKVQGFFPSDEEEQAPYNESGNLPDDLIEISDEDYAAWINPPAGKCSAWMEGKPVLIDAPAVNYILEAETKRQQLLSEAQGATYTINLKLAMGRTLTDKEKVKVNAWLDYVDELNDIDLSTAPDIVWPEQPTA